MEPCMQKSYFYCQEKGWAPQDLVSQAEYARIFKAASNYQQGGPCRRYAKKVNKRLDDYGDSKTLRPLRLRLDAHVQQKLAQQNINARPL